MNKTIRKRISILLCITILLCDNMGIFSFAGIVENNVASESIVKTVDENREELKQNNDAKLSSDSESNENIDKEAGDVTNGEGEDGENIPKPESDNIDPILNMLKDASSSSESESNEDDLLLKTLESIVEATLSNTNSNASGNKNKTVSSESNTKNNLLTSNKNMYMSTASITSLSNTSLKTTSASVATDSDVEIHGLGFIPINMKIPAFKKKKKLFASAGGSGLPTKFDSRASISNLKSGKAIPI